MLLFPIKWDEPLGSVMVEARACATPVLALRAGWVPEVVKEGVSGHVSRRIDELVKRAKDLRFDPIHVRQYAAENFSQQRMAREYRTLYNRILEQNHSLTGAVA